MLIRNKGHFWSEIKVNFADSNYSLKIRIFLPILWMKMKSKSALLFKNIQKYNAQSLIPVISFTN